MSTGSGGKPPSGSPPGSSTTAVARPAADTPQRMVVRGQDSDAGDSRVGMHDTAVAANEAEAGNRTSLSGEHRAGPRTPGDGTSEIVGQTLSGRYLVTRKVGQGGMGAVYEATHTLIGKRVAVKVLLEKYAKREAIVQRLEQEAKLASSLRNEHIIDITDFGQTEDGRTFVVMEYLEGESLAECLAREQKLPEQRILRLAAQTAAALAAAHDKGVVHRDIKPENLFLLQRKETDFVKVLDFGISKSLRASGEEEQPRLTQTGMVLGTPLYMSPEQSRGDDDLDHRVDIYALGVIMYEASTGRVPFIGTNYLSVISQVLNEAPPPPRELRPELTEEFEAVVQRAMAKDRNERYASARDLAADLNQLVDDPTRSTERAKITGPRKKAPPQRKSGLKILGWAAGVAVLIAAVVVTVSFAMSSGPIQPAPRAQPPLVTPPPVADAAVVAPPIDAEEAAIVFTIATEPPGAHVFRESEDMGRAPARIPIIDKDKDVHVHAELDGYLDGVMVINPHEDKSRLTRTITLKKAPKGAPPQVHEPHAVPHAGTGSAIAPVSPGSGVRGDGTMGSNPIH